MQYLQQMLKQDAIRGVVLLKARSDEVFSLPSSYAKQEGARVEILNAHGLSPLSREKILLLNEGVRSGWGWNLAERYSDWRACRYASWSHTDEWLALWVGRKKSLAYGLDIESPWRVTPEILARIRHPSDISLASWSSMEMPLLWSVKEASFKALSRFAPSLGVISQICVPFWQIIGGGDFMESDMRAFRFQAAALSGGGLALDGTSSLTDTLADSVVWARGLAVISSELPIAVAEAPIIRENTR